MLSFSRFPLSIRFSFYTSDLIYLLSLKSIWSFHSLYRDVRHACEWPTLRKSYVISFSLFLLISVDIKWLWEKTKS